MNKITLTAITCSFATLSFSQFNTTWTNNTSNSLNTGFIGIGVRTTSTVTNQNADFNFQVHGVVDYTVPLTGTVPGGGTSIATSPGGKEPIANSSEKSTINYGKTARIGLTNSTTGKTQFDGTVLRQSNNDFVIRNQEDAGNIDIGINSLGMNFSGSTNRIWVGSTGTTASNFARFNLRGTDNGLFVETMGLNKFGISVKMAGATDKAFQVFANDGTTRNFSVLGNGQVFARKYTTTLANIPDYVFESSYDLRSIEELRSYVETNKHLPNIPSAKEYEENGVDLGEMNRLLLEKTEELTLYIFQLEERLKKLEASTQTSAENH